MKRKHETPYTDACVSRGSNPVEKEPTLVRRNNYCVIIAAGKSEISEED